MDAVVFWIVGALLLWLLIRRIRSRGRGSANPQNPQFRVVRRRVAAPPAMAEISGSVASVTGRATPADTVRCVWCRDLVARRAATICRRRGCGAARCAGCERERRRCGGRCAPGR